MKRKVAALLVAVVAGWAGLAAADVKGLDGLR